MQVNIVPLIVFRYCVFSQMNFGICGDTSLNGNEVSLEKKYMHIF